MSQKLALVAAAAAATVQAKGFCATFGGVNICNEEIEAVLESEKINITGCATIGKVQVCKNSEETGLFEEEQEQGWCVEVKGIKFCKEEVDMVLESEKIDITGCVKVGKVEFCKNSEEQEQLFFNHSIFNKPVEVYPYRTLDEGIRQNGDCPMIGGIKYCLEEQTSIFEEEEQQQQQEQQRMEKRASSSSSCPMIGGQMYCRNFLLEEEQEGAEGKAIVNKHEQPIKKIKKDPLPRGTLKKQREERRAKWIAKMKKNPKAILALKSLPAFKKSMKNISTTTTTLDEDELEIAEQGFWKKVGNFFKKIFNNVNISVAFEEEMEEEFEGDLEQGRFWRSLATGVKKFNVVPLEEQEQTALLSMFHQIKKYQPQVLPALLDQDELGLVVSEQNFLKDPKFWKTAGKVVVAVLKVILEEEDEEQIIRPDGPFRPKGPIMFEEEQVANKHRQLQKFIKPSSPTPSTLPSKKPFTPHHHPKWSKLTPEERKAKLENWAKLTPEEKKAKIEQWKAKHAARRAEWSKLTPEERKAKLAEWKAKRAHKKQKPTKQAPIEAPVDVFEEEQEQGWCIEIKGIKVCKEQIEAVLESERIGITGCVKVGKVEFCKNSEETGLFEEEQGICVEFKGIKVCSEQIEAAMETEGFIWSGCASVGKAKVCKQ